MAQSTAKSSRVLEIYSRLVNGEILGKEMLAQQYQVAQRSIQRDMEDLRCFLSEQMLKQDIVYDHRAKGYRLIHAQTRSLTKNEIFVICKVLLESRSMTKDEIMPILDKLVDCCTSEEDRKRTAALLANEKFHYIEPRHGQHIQSLLWELGEAVQQKLVIEIRYEKLKKDGEIYRSLEPVGLLFSEYYFYLVAFIRDINKQEAFENPADIFPTIYRVDRIRSMKVSTTHFQVPYANRFEEGEFRKRVQFMYGGTLQRIRFRYTGPSLEAVLDRLPTAEILEESAEGWIIEAETFGKGIHMWLNSQGSYVEVIDMLERGQKQT